MNKGLKQYDLMFQTMWSKVSNSVITKGHNTYTLGHAQYDMVITFVTTGHIYCDLKVITFVIVGYTYCDFKVITFVTTSHNNYNHKFV